jgi:transposase
MDRKIIEMLQAGSSLRTITETLHVGDRRVRRLRMQAEEHGYLGSSAKPLPPYPENLFPDVPETNSRARSSDADQALLEKREWIIERLSLGWHPITIYEELGLSVGRSSFYRFLERHRLDGVGEKARASLRVVPEIVHRPGEALLLDWGKLRDVIDPETGKKRALWAFVGVLGFSRYLTVRLVWSNDVPTTMTAIQSMFRELGGVPERITSDNPKCFSLEASRYEPILNPVFERMAAHYGVIIECLPPADPQKKGKVERPMPYIRRLYQAHGDVWHGLEESQAYLDQKLVIANQRKHGTTREQPIAQFETIEAKALRALPPLSYEPETFSSGAVRRDGHVRFENKYYSLPERFIGSRVVLLGSASHVAIYCEGKLIETHERVTDPLRSKSTKMEHLKPWEREMLDDSIYRTRARAIGADVDRFVERVIARGQGFVDTRKIWGVLSLDKTFTKERINEACRQAIALDTLSFRMVKSLCKLTDPPEAPSADERAASSLQQQHSHHHKFVRPLSVYEEQLELTLH